MTTEEAIRILDPNTTREALAEIEYYGGFSGKRAKIEACDEAYRIAVAALSTQQDSSGWISVEDRMPEIFRPVIVCREKGKGKYVVEQGCKDVGDWWKVYGTRIKTVTHWMPLPEPPKEEHYAEV